MAKLSMLVPFICSRMYSASVEESDGKIIFRADRGSYGQEVIEASDPNGEPLSLQGGKPDSLPPYVLVTMNGVAVGKGFLRLLGEGVYDIVLREHNFL